MIKERTDTIVDESDWQVRYTDNQTLGELKVERMDIIEDGGDWQVSKVYLHNNQTREGEDIYHRG